MANVAQSITVILAGRPERILVAWKQELAKIGVSATVARTQTDGEGPGNKHALGLQVSPAVGRAWSEASRRLAEAGNPAGARGITLRLETMASLLGAVVS